MTNFLKKLGLFSLLFCYSLSASSATATWVAGFGEWLQSASFWDIGFPSAGDDIVINDPSLQQRLVVTGLNPNINSLTIGTNNLGIDPDEFHIVNARTVTVSNAGINNDGIISLNAGANATSLLLSGSATISGSGSIVMNNSSNNIIRNSGGNDTLTLASGATIRGAGTLIGNFGGMINNGTIIADQATKLVIDTDTEGFAQAGTLRATGTGGLHILNTPFTNTNGIDIEAGSNLLVEGSTIVGGAINIDPTASATFITSSNLDAVTINGDVTHNNNQTVDIFNGLTLNGTWNMNGGANSTNLLVHGDQSILGYDR